VGVGGKAQNNKLRSSDSKRRCVECGATAGQTE